MSASQNDSFTDTKTKTNKVKINTNLTQLSQKNKKMQEINNRLKNSRSQNSLLIGKEMPLPCASSEYGLEKKQADLKPGHWLQGNQTQHILLTEG